METWKDFENSCYNYLVETYGKNCKFEALGQSDSTMSDIKVLTNNSEFYIETKESLAQCGQFVLYPDTNKKTFIYSQQNKSELNKYSKAIIDYMNENFESFADAGTRGVDIPVDYEILYDWIKNYYNSKEVRFFITKDQDYIIFPIEQFDRYFSVSAKYRVKKSGSSNPSKSNIDEIKQILLNNSFVFELYVTDNKMYIKTSSDIDGLKLTGSNYTYLFKKTEPQIYNIRKLSNTHNANVIFSIKLKAPQNIEDLKKFITAVSK